jgi:glucose/arabinose dehydrogenase
MRIPLLLKRLSIGLGVLLGLSLLALAAFVWWGPVAVSDKGVLFNMLAGRSIGAPTDTVVQTQFVLPPEFKLQLFAADVPGVRLLQITPHGDVLASLPRLGQVLWLARDRNGDGRSDQQRVLLNGLNRPHGIDLHENWLYVAENDAVGRVRLDETYGQLAGDYRRIVTGLSGNGNHWSKTARIGPDGMLYLTQGSTCNVCVEADPRRAAMMRFNADGSDAQLIATGLRNSVGFDWAPWDNALYATENSRDLLGDDIPNEELNRIQPGGFYGWPAVHGLGVVDAEFGKESARILVSLPPVHGFRAHNAPLGIRFLRNPAAGYERSALVALHGSWNRSTPDGYKVVSLHWSVDGKIEEKDFLTGFLGKDGVIGRPVDIAEDANGVLYISDDYAGAIYQVTSARNDVGCNAYRPCRQ